MKFWKIAGILLFGVGSPVASASSLELESYEMTGAREAVILSATDTGARLVYGNNAASGRNDTGLVVPIDSGSRTPFANPGDTMTYRFRLGGITATNNQFTPLYRVGFDFGSTGILRYETSTGTAPRIGFGSNDNGNPFSRGTVHVVHEDWAPFALKDIRFDDGNEIEVTVSLGLLAADDGLYDYEMTVSYVSTLNPSDTNTKRYTFTGVNGNEVVGLFHVTNSAGMVKGDAYTVSDASLNFEEATSLDQTAVQVDALPEATAEERVKKAVLEMGIERALNAQAVSLSEEAAAIHSDVQEALSREASEFAMRNPDAPAHLPILRPMITAYEDNLYLQRLVQQTNKDLAGPDVPWPRALTYNGTIEGLGGATGSRTAYEEMGNYLWLFGHEESPMKSDPELVKRILRRAHAYMDSLELAPDVDVDPVPNWYDQFAVYSAFTGLWEIRSLYPGLLLPGQLARWDTIMEEVAINMQGWGFLQRDHSPWNINIETGRVIGALVAALWTENAWLRNRAMDHVDATTARVFPDGGVPYHGMGHASTNYHNALLEQWLVFYELTGHEPILDAMVDTEWKGPAMGRTEEFWTSPFYKTFRWNYNKGTEAGSELVAAMTRNPYARFLLDRDMFSDGYFGPGTDISFRYQIPWYDSTVVAKPLPGNYTIADRNAGGPRAWYGNWNYAGSFRPNPDSTRYEGHETLMGAMTVDDDGQVNSILVAVTPRIWQTPEPTDTLSAWARLTMDEVPATTISRNYSVATSIHGTTRVRSGAYRTGVDSGWTSRQLWVGLPDRIVGLVSTVPTAGAAAAYAVNGVLRFISGGTTGAKTLKGLEEITPDAHYRYGQLDILVHDTTYASLSGLEVAYRVPAFPATELTFSNRASEPLPASGQMNFPSGTEFRFVVEIRPTWTTTDLENMNVLGDQEVIGLEFTGGERSFQVWLNASGLTRNVSLQRGNLPAGMDSFVLSNGVLGRVPFQSNIPGSVDLEHGQHALLVVSSDPEDHQVGWRSFAEMVATPFLTIAPRGDELQIEHRGMLQESSDLKTWTLMNPQPASPLSLPLEVGGKRFFKIQPMNGDHLQQ